MTEASGLSSAGVGVEPDLLAEAVSHELAAMLQVGNYDAVKVLLEPSSRWTSPRRSGAFPPTCRRLLPCSARTRPSVFMSTSTPPPNRAAEPVALRRNAGGDGGDAPG